MRFLLLKFCYGVEIGAYLAYVGHYKATKDSVVKSIKREELTHMVYIKRVLAQYGHKPSLLFNLMFLAIGHTIRLSCAITPVVVLDAVAQIMEVFNIVSYDLMAKLFPIFKDVFLEMQKNEAEHEVYFSTFPKRGRK